MKFNRRKILAMLGVVAPLLLNGCITPQLFENRSYRENVSSVLISADEKNVVVITDKYHYIFSAPDTLVRTLKSSLHKNVAAKINTFHVDENGSTFGRVDLTVDDKSTAQELNEAISYGFTKSGNGAYAILQLEGMRYDKNNISPQLESQKLRKPYLVIVTEPQTVGEKAVKVLITPITLAADGALVIGAIPLVLMGYGGLL